MVRHIRTRYFLHVAHVVHTAVIMGIMPLIGLICAACATIAYGATATVSLGVGDTSILVHGKSSPHSLVTIVDGTNIVGTTTTAADGLFSKKLTAVQPGIHRLQIYARDTQNRLTDSIQIEMSATEHFQTDAYVFLPPTIAAAQPIINPGQPINYSGSTYSNAEVTLFFNEDEEYIISANTEGQWSQTIATDDLPLGTYEAYAHAVDTATTEQSYTTLKLAVSIILPAPQPIPADPRPAQPAPQPRPGRQTIRPTTILPLPGATSDNPITIRGTAEPLAQVELYNGGRPIGSVFADKKGNWSITLSLQDAEYILRARACTERACSSLSNAIRFVYQPTSNARHFWAWLGQHAYVAPAGSTLTVRVYTGNGALPYETTVDWGDGSQTKRRQQSNNLTLNHTYKRAGTYQGTVSITDDSNKTALSMFTVRTTPVSQAQSLKWPLILTALLILGLVIISTYAYWHLRRHAHSGH